MPKQEETKPILTKCGIEESDVSVYDAPPLLDKDAQTAIEYYIDTSLTKELFMPFFNHGITPYINFGNKRPVITIERGNAIYKIHLDFDPDSLSDTALSLSQGKFVPPVVTALTITFNFGFSYVFEIIDEPLTVCLYYTHTSRRLRIALVNCPTKFQLKFNKDETVSHVVTDQIKKFYYETKFQESTNNDESVFDGMIESLMTGGSLDK